MTKKKGLLNTSRLTNYIYLFVALFLMNPISAYGEGFEEENHFGRTTKARLEVEKAWDVYHDGALGGTLQSPKVQTKLEMDLHQSRALLAEAYEAEDKGDLNKTKDLIQNIMLITHRVISESKVQKK
jgi:hypothetical protein|tara:strand:- start:695 stop:1075 length:381 start_codon:yes stop_codon:yes gene_type:complete